MYQSLDKNINIPYETYKNIQTIYCILPAVKAKINKNQSH